MKKNKIILAFVLLIPVFAAGCMTGLSREKMNERVHIARARYASSDWTIRKAAVEEASNYSVDAAKTFLKRAATDDSHAAVRSAALDGLVDNFAGDDTMKLCMHMAENDRSRTVRYDALNHLVIFEDPEAFDLFAKQMDHDDWLFREAAISGICTIQDQKIEQKSIPYIVDALKDPNKSVRIAALEHIHIKDPKIYNEIRKFFFTDDYEYRITYLLATLKALKGYDLDIRVRERIEQLIVHPNVDIRVHALRALKSEPAYKKDR